MNLKINLLKDVSYNVISPLCQNCNGFSGLRWKMSVIVLAIYIVSLGIFSVGYTLLNKRVVLEIQ